MALDSIALAPPLEATDRSAETLRRLRAMRPRRAPHIQLGSVRQNNRLVYRAHDPLSGRTTELSPLAAELLLACDGQHDLGGLMRRIARQQPDADEQQLAEEALAIIASAESSGLILPVEAKSGGFVAPVIPSVFWRTVRNPLFARFSLFNPTPMFDRLKPLADVLFSTGGLVVWLAIVAVGAALAIGNWDELVRHASDQALAAHNLIWLVVLFPMVKVLHETGHALACTRWGGQVRDFGVSMMVFVPIPFVDCSDSTFFVRRRQRIAVAAAGMMVEFVIATLALCTWLVSTDELVRLLAFNLLVLTSVTTVLFNANPLLRFDAYYILSELLGIENLGSKSQGLIGAWARRVFLGAPASEVPQRPLFETLVLLGYGIGSFCYRITLVFVIVSSIFPRFFFLGFVLAAWAAITTIVLPLYRQSTTIFGALDKSTPQVRRRFVFTVGALILVAATVLAVPLPYAVVADGTIRLPPESIVRASEAGVVERLPYGISADVNKGDDLVVLSNPQLDAELNANRATLVSQQWKYQAQLASDLAEAALTQADMGVTEEDIADDERRVAALVVEASAAGRFEAADGMRQGIYIEEGGPIGVVLDGSPHRSAIVLVAQEDADLINSRLASVAVRQVGVDSRTRPARLEREYLVTLRGRPTGNSAAPTQNRFAFELGIEAGSDLPFGQAVKVRFDLGTAPLAVQIWRSLHIWYEKLMLSHYIDEAS
jgi:putative peptide zinc metalloprotease protein